MYTNFASVYDYVMRDVNYVQWAEYYTKLIKTMTPTAEQVVECACGTGSLTEHLAKNFHVIGLDSSADMLSFAQQKVPLSVMLTQQDMRHFTLPHKVDAVLATCDGVNYLLKEDDVLKFFVSANKALNSGGVLCFDVSSPYKLYTLLPSQPWVDDDDTVSYIWQNEVENQVVHLYLSFFEKDGRHYNRIDEHQKQTCFSVETYTKLLHQAGFSHVQCFGEQTFESPQEKAQRLHFVALKENEQ